MSGRESTISSDREERDRPTYWSHATNLILGVWLMTTPFAVDWTQAELGTAGAERLAAERDLPEPALRAQVLRWNNVACGLLVVLFAGWSLSPRNLWAPWATTLVGLWLLMAPLVLWAPTAALYANDTLVGSLIVAFAVLIPGPPRRTRSTGIETPPGWNYNPSSYLQRAPIIALALCGFFIARYMAAYQLGHLATVWDAFFPDGTRRILESKVSLAWPVSDAGLGAVSYLLEALSGYIGDGRRWRTMPWMVILFGIMVVPLGVTSIVLIILQPVAVGAWCSLCLLTAAAMLIMIAPALDEVIATCQFLAYSRRSGKPFWKTFWKGGDWEGASEPSDATRLSPAKGLIQATGFHNIPWNLAAAAALGIWLLFSPNLFGTTGMAAHSDHIAGALIVTFSVIAFGEVARGARFLNIVLALWIMIGPWFLESTAAARWNDVAIGAAVLLLSLPLGRREDRFGSWDRFVF